MTTVAIASWLLTYLVHSTVLLGVVWLVSRTLADRHLGVQETLLRTALIGGVITSSLQMCLGFEPLAGAFAFDVLERPQATISASTEASGFSFTADDPITTSGAGMATTKNAIDAWTGILLTVWGAGSLLAFLVLGRSMLDLRRLLKTRRFRPAGRLVERLAAAMGLDRRVLLSTSKAIAVPFATGVRRPEICCPDRVRDLAIEHQTGLFAHELAHLARRDPAWQLLYRVGEAILFLQPLNRLVRRRLEEIAEDLTDERAAACTGDRLGLARCLVVIAHWGSSSRLGVPATTLASGPRLGRRVRKLLNGRPAANEKPVWVVPMVVCILSAAALTLPLVASTSADAEVTATKTGLASAKTWSEAEDAPPGTPVPPDQPAPADTTPSTSPRLRPPAPDTAPAPAPARVDSLRAPSAGPSKPAPASAPAPAVAPSPRTEAVPPSPSAPPVPPRTPEERSSSQDADSTAEREREKTEKETEDRQRSAERERANAERRAEERARRADEQAQERMRQAEAHAQQHRERARQRAEEAEQRRRLTEEMREELGRRADEMRAMAQARAREMDRTSEERARAAEERAQRLAERAAERAERAAVHRDELRHQALEANRKMRENARRLSEEARKLAEEAEKKALAEKPEKDD